MSSEPASWDALPGRPGLRVLQDSFLSSPAGDGQLHAPDWRAPGRGQTADGRSRCLQNEPTPDARGHSALAPEALGKVLGSKGHCVAMRNAWLSGNGCPDPQEMLPERNQLGEKGMGCG